MRCTLYETWTVMTLASLVFLKPKMAAYTTHEYCRAMTVVEYLAKEKEKK